MGTRFTTSKSPQVEIEDTTSKSHKVTFLSITVSLLPDNYVNIRYVEDNGWNTAGGSSSYHFGAPFEKANHILSCISRVLYNLNHDLLPEHFFRNVCEKPGSITHKLMYENYNSPLYQKMQQIVSFMCPFDDGSITKIGFVIGDSNPSTIMKDSLDDFEKDGAKEIIAVVVDMYYKILLASSRYYFKNDDLLIEFVTSYPIVLNNSYEYLSTIFSQIFDFKSHITFERKNHIYKLLTERLHVIPFGKKLLVDVCQSSRIIEASKHLHHGCSCCIASDKGYYYGEIMDHLILNGYSMSDFGPSFLPIHVIMNECNFDYVKWYIKKYGTSQLNTPTSKSGFYPTMMLFGGFRRTVGNDDEISKILEYLIDLQAIDFSVKDKEGNSIYDHCNNMHYPKSKMVLESKTLRVSSPA